MKGATDDEYPITRGLQSWLTRIRCKQKQESNISNLKTSASVKAAGVIAPRAEAQQLQEMREMTGNTHKQAVKQINALNGWIKIDAKTDGNYIIESQTMSAEDDMKLTKQEIEMRYDDMIDLRAMLWDAMRKQGRGTEISIEKVLQIEEVRHKGRYSVTGYEEEINWTIEMLKRHLDRVAAWKGTPAKDRAAYGKLDEFLSEFVE